MLNADRIEVVYIDCLYGKDPDGSEVIADGILSRTAFRKEKLGEYRAEIEAALAELPESFHQSGGGGMSFLSARDDKHGNQWTGLHQRMDQLFQLGMAIGRVKCCLPREIWKVLPGGMPYYVITTT